MVWEDMSFQEKCIDNRRCTMGAGWRLGTKAHLQPTAQVNLKGNSKQGFIFHYLKTNKAYPEFGLIV